MRLNKRSLLHRLYPGHRYRRGYGFRHGDVIPRTRRRNRTFKAVSVDEDVPHRTVDLCAKLQRQLAGAGAPYARQGYDAPQPQQTAARMGGFGGGVSLFIQDGYLRYEYNAFEIERTKLKSAEKLPIGDLKIEVKLNKKRFYEQENQTNIVGNRSGLHNKYSSKYFSHDNDYWAIKHFERFRRSGNIDAY